MKGTKPTKILVGGNKQAAQDFVGPAKSQMEILKKQMSFQNRSQGVRRVWLYNDVYVECVKCFNYQECKIWVRPVVPEPLETEIPKYEELIYLKVFLNGSLMFAPGITKASEDFDHLVKIYYDDDVDDEYSTLINFKNFTILPLLFSPHRIKRKDWGEEHEKYIFPNARFALSCENSIFPYNGLFFYLCPADKGNHDHFMCWEYIEYPVTLLGEEGMYKAVRTYVEASTEEPASWIGNEEGVRYYKRVRNIKPENNLVFKQPYEYVSATDEEAELSFFPENSGDAGLTWGYEYLEDLWPAKFSAFRSPSRTYKAYHVNFEVKSLQQQNTQYEMFDAKESFDVITRTMDIENAFSFLIWGYITQFNQYNFGIVYPYEGEYNNDWPYLPWAPEYTNCWPYPSVEPERHVYMRSYSGRTEYPLDFYGPIIDYNYYDIWTGPPPTGYGHLFLKEEGRWRWVHICDALVSDNVSFDSIAIISDENGLNPSFTPLEIEYVSKQFKSWEEVDDNNVISNLIRKDFELKQTIRFEMVDGPPSIWSLTYSGYPPYWWPWRDEWLANT